MGGGARVWIRDGDEQSGPECLPAAHTCTGKAALYIWEDFLTASWHPVPLHEERKRMVDLMV